MELKTSPRAVTGMLMILISAIPRTISGNGWDFVPILLAAVGIALLVSDKPAENTVPEPGAEVQQEPKRQIIITLNDEGGATLTSNGLNMHDAVAALEISKLQIISQFTQGGTGPMEIIRRK